MLTGCNILVMHFFFVINILLPFSINVYICRQEELPGFGFYGNMICALFSCIALFGFFFLLRFLGEGHFWNALCFEY